MNSEIWKVYPEFDFVQGSNLGRVRTVDRYVKQGSGKRFVKGHILKQHLNIDGYLCVLFRVNGKQVNRRVNRIIAQTFIPNPYNLPEVNHKDCDRINNCVDNLEWCSPEYNVAYREKYGEALNCPVIAVSLATFEILQFESQSEAGQELGVSQGNISEVLKGNRKSAGGYWFINDNEQAIESIRAKFGDKVAAKVEQ